MTTLSTKFSGRRMLSAVWLATHACVACGGSDSRVPGDAFLDSGGTSASGGINSNGGMGGCELSPNDASDSCMADASAGSGLGNGGNVGSAGRSAAAGAAGTPDLAEGGTSGDQGASGASGENGASGESNSPFVPAPHVPYPRVAYHGGPIIKNLELVPVYFGDDPLRDDLERFTTWIGASDYWTKAGAEYGVYEGKHLTAAHFEKVPTSPISDSQIATWIDARVADGSLPKPSVNTVFVLFFPAETTITAGTSASSCNDFAALHEFAAIANPVFTGNVPFAIIPRCSFSPGDELMIATNSASHELFEAATNPLSTDPAWHLDGPDGSPLEAWQILGGLEVADLCQSHYYDVIDGFTVQRIWSDKAAQAGDNPCQPNDPRHPFFSVTADLTIYHAQPGTTLEVHALAWSNQPTADWKLGVNWVSVPGSDFDGQAVLSRATVNNGDEVTATITIPATLPVTIGRSVYRFSIDSIDPINPNFANPWPFMIVVP
ncbi:MAG TPA: hypothetical protein VER96_33625 [Polyangiaceae bacterium]|nr:hypothetical protein [Polyangiaceae bacterium]